MLEETADSAASRLVLRTSTIVLKMRHATCVKFKDEDKCYRKLPKQFFHVFYNIQFVYFIPDKKISQCPGKKLMHTTKHREIF